jgi:hypothetical protein
MTCQQRLLRDQFRIFLFTGCDVKSDDEEGRLTEREKKMIKMLCVPVT